MKLKTIKILQRDQEQKLKIKRMRAKVEISINKRITLEWNGQHEF
jgi:hypothetical protein